MEDLLNMITSDESSASEISDKIKDILYSKSLEKINLYKPEVATNLFSNGPEVEDWFLTYIIV